MYIGEHSALFERFLERNHRFWSDSGRGPSAAGDIVVDLAHDNHAYLFTNLLLAKYYQRLRGGRLVGIAKSWPEACPHFDVHALRWFAESFRIDEFVDIDEISADGAGTAADFLAAVEGKSGPELRRAVLSYELDRDPDTGWLLYDTYLRGKRAATFHRAGEDLAACAAAFFRTRAAVAQCFARRDVAAAIVGHYHYSPYAFFALNAFRRGGRVFFQSLLLPFSVTEFRSAEEMRRGRLADFPGAYLETLARVPAGRLESFAGRVFDVQEGARQFFRRAEADGAPADPGLDPSVPTVALFSPALSGAPHAFGRFAFDDFADWIERTLDFATWSREVNVLVKPHPMDEVYDTTGLLAHFARRYSDVPNIRFLPRDAPVPPCDVVVTTNGTPGYEMPLRGVPAIAVAPSRYAGLGIAAEPRTVEAYLDLLRNCRGLTVTSAAARRALEFAYFEMVARRSHSIFPPLPAEAGTAAFWQDALRNLQAHAVEEDQLYRNFAAMLGQGSPFLVNTDLLSPVAEYRFGTGSAFQALLGAGWSDPEPGGVWSIGSVASLRVPAAGLVEVEVDAVPYDPPRDFAVYVGGRIGTRAEADGTLDIAVRVPCPARPGGGDGRALGVALTAVRVRRLV